MKEGKITNYKILFVFKQLILILFGIIVFYLLLASWFSTSYIGTHVSDMNGETHIASYHTFYYGDNFWIHLLCLSGIVGIFILISRIGFCKGKQCILKQKYMKISLLVFYIVLGIWWVMNTQWQPNSDQLTLLKIVDEMMQGDFSSFMPGGYIEAVPHQVGILLFFYSITKLVGDYNIIVIQLLNVFVISLSSYLLASLIGRKEQKNQMLSLLVQAMLILFIPSFCYITFIYGNGFSLFLVIVSVYLTLQYLDKTKILYAILSIICMVWAIQLKPNSLIFFIALSMVIFYECIKNKKNRGIYLWILMSISILIGNFMTEVISEQVTGIKQEGGVPSIAYVAMGLQEGREAFGWWNSYTIDTYRELNYDSDAVSQDAVAEIVKTCNRFKENPITAVRFFCKKVTSQWNNPTFEGIYISWGRETTIQIPKVIRSLFTGNLHFFFMQFMNIYQSILLVGIVLFCGYKLCSKELLDNKWLFLILSFLGGFTFHLFWEAKCQYAVPYFVLIIPCSVMGYVLLIEQCNKWINHMKNDVQCKTVIMKTVIKIIFIISILFMISKTTMFTKLIGLNEDGTYIEYEQVITKNQ